MHNEKTRLRPALLSPNLGELVAAFDALSHGICVLDDQGRVRFCNTQFLNFFTLQCACIGVPVADLLARALAIAAQDSVTAAVLLNHTRMTESRAPVMLRHHLPDGRTLNISHTPLATGGSVQVYEDVSERLNEESRIRSLSRHDSLTGLPNRALFRDHFEQAVAANAGVRQSGALLILDMNRFKEVNDALGHHVGDRLLQGVVIRVKRCLRQGNFFARLGGDEFGIIITQNTSGDDPIALAERINALMEHPFRLDGHQIYSTISIGVALFGSGTVADEPANLMRCADIAMYRAKAGGRNTFRVFEERMDLELRERKALEQDLTEAMERGQFSLKYQPQIDLARRTVCGVEALLRWQHPERGAVSPGVFIGTAEALGLIVPLGEWVLRTACLQGTAWPDLSMAVNVSPIQLRHSGFTDMLRRILQETGLPPHQLTIEITEGVLLEDTEKIMATLHSLAELGLKIALDDFGTGYSNFSYLRQFPWHKLKIDRSFIKDLEDGVGSAAIVKGLLALGHGLGVRVVAEGIETMGQLKLLRQSKCDEVQGFLLGVPMDIATLETFRAGWRDTHRSLFAKPARRPGPETGFG